MCPNALFYFTNVAISQKVKYNKIPSHLSTTPGISTGTFAPNNGTDVL